MKQLVASIGSLLATGAALLCPACPTGLAGLLGALGLSTLAAVVVLKPVLVGLLGLAVLGLVVGYGRHGRLWPLLGGILGAAALYAGRWVLFDVPLLYGGAATLVAACVADNLLQRRIRPCCRAPQSSGMGP